MFDQHSALILSLDLDNYSHPRYGALGIIQYAFDSMRGTLLTFFPVHDLIDRQAALVTPWVDTRSP